LVFNIDVRQLVQSQRKEDADSAAGEGDMKTSRGGGVGRMEGSEEMARVEVLVLAL
jgi:hypothetical protein